MAGTDGGVTQEGQRGRKGGFATVYRAYDTIEGIRVALKIPHQRFFTKETLGDFRKEARLTHLTGRLKTTGGRYALANLTLIALQPA